MIRTSTRTTDGARAHVGAIARGRTAAAPVRGFRARLAAGTATLAAAALLLAGCAGASTPAERALDDLQQRTLSVTQSSADGDFDKALAQLDELQAAVEADLADGSVDQARHDEVVARIAEVRAQLEAARDAAQETPTPSAEPTEPAPSETASPTPTPSATPTPTPTRTTTPSPTPTPTPTEDEGDDDDDGNNGNGNGNGDGNSGNGNSGNGNGNSG